jgi:hypothetical protein
LETADALFGSLVDQRVGGSPGYSIARARFFAARR